ncbi:MAG TPA: tripartite tricarboxylate transporter substrate binding protein [Burkholderiaceae bacterium]|nr:tripartite tricarboxylate transporter substrate binding protein [Burkholderiaceae bacterium]
MLDRPASRRFSLAALAACALAALPASGLAQAWPSKPIRLIVGFAPGGGTDIIARAMAPRLSELLGAQVVVENRAGASGAIGADMVAKAAPDGYTLVMGHSNPNAIVPFVFKVPYDPANDFTPIHYIGYVPNILAVHPSIGVKTVDELVALARSKPGVLTYASSGIGSSQHLAGALFTKITGTQMNHVPYKGSGQAITDLLAGQVSMNFDTMPPVLPHITGGKLRALAISTPTRMPQLPDVPTFNEVGIRGFDVTNWYSVMGPKGMPRDLVLKIADAVRKSLDDPAIKGKLEPQGVIAGGPRTPEEFSTFLKAELTKYSTLVKELGVRAE